MKEKSRHQTVSLVRPEAFRIIFCCSLCVMLGIGIIMSRIAIGATLWWNDFIAEDNPVLRRFGANNICIYFDKPPFTYFSAATWIVLLINVSFYQIRDMFRTHDAYCDGHISKKFYTITTAIETTKLKYCTPDESMIMHTMPYVFLIDAFFFIAIKIFLYFKVTDITDHYPIRMLGIMYFVLFLLSAIGKSFIILEWTTDCTVISEQSFLVLICPFFVVNAILETVTIDRIMVVLEQFLN